MAWYDAPLDAMSWLARLAQGGSKKSPPAGKSDLEINADRISQAQAQPTQAPTMTPTPAAPTATPTPPISIFGAKPSDVHSASYGTFLQNIRKGENFAKAKPTKVPPDLYQAIKGASKSTGVPESILLAIADTETNFRSRNDETGVGLQGGRGYFQIDLGQHPDVTEAQANDPVFAANYAAHLISNHVHAYRDTPDPISNAIRSYNGSPDNPKTKVYLNKVIDNLKTKTYN